MPAWAVALLAKYGPIVGKYLLQKLGVVVDDELSKLTEEAPVVPLPFQAVEEQRRQAQAGARHGTVQGPPLPKPPTPGRE